MEVFVIVHTLVVGAAIAVLCSIAVRWHRRRVQGPDSVQGPGVQGPGAHDAHVAVDESAWAEIVDHLRNEGIDGDPGGGRRAGGSQ